MEMYNILNIIEMYKLVDPVLLQCPYTVTWPDKETKQALRRSQGYLPGDLLRGP